MLHSRYYLSRRSSREPLSMGVRSNPPGWAPLETPGSRSHTLRRFLVKIRTVPRQSLAKIRTALHQSLAKIQTARRQSLARIQTALRRSLVNALRPRKNPLGRKSSALPCLVMLDPLRSQGRLRPREQSNSFSRMARLESAGSSPVCLAVSAIA
jgi:hypothetical protein